jgi:endonuclease-3
MSWSQPSFQKYERHQRDRAFVALRAEFSLGGVAMQAKDVIDTSPSGAGKSRARIQQVLKAITEERGDLDLSFLKKMSVDDARAWLTKFNGVGPKTAAIVLCFSLGMPAFPVDTHVYRVTGRIGLHPEKMTSNSAPAPRRVIPS